MIFFLTLTVSGPFHRKDFKFKKTWGTGLISEKKNVLYTELNERADEATGSYSVTGDSLHVSILCLRIIGASDQDV